MRLRLIALAFLSATLAGLVLGCNNTQDDSKKGEAGAPPSEARNTDVGAPLFPPVPAPASPVERTKPPIVISPAIVQFDERQVISAETDGLFELFATYYKPGEKPDDRLVYHPRDTETDPDKRVKLKRLTEGDEVTKDQVLAFMDDQQVVARINGAKEVKKAAVEALGYAKEGAGQAGERVKLVMKGGSSLAEVIDAQLTLARFRENEANARQTIAKTTAELEEMTVMLQRHQIKSRVNGVIRSIAKRPGEYVKAGEKIMEIEATDRVRIEGQLDVQYTPFIHRGMAVFVEPSVPSAPLAYHKGHRAAVTGLAVTSHADGPLVASVAAEGSALVWDPNLGKKVNRPNVPHILPHPERIGVRSVAATPPSSKTMLVITGADDGKIRIWDVSNRDKLPTAPKIEPTDAHTSGVQALAISPDGRFFASAAGRDVFIWELASAKKLYTLDAEHRDNITAIYFTPQNTLVTASKDGTLKVWKLGTERAAVVRTIDHRAGAVEVLGVSRDGGRVLFDQDKGRLDLVDPANGQTIGQIENVNSAGSFSTFAVFGPEEPLANTPADQQPYSIATGGDGDLKGTVQYWLAPRTGGRGAEVGRLITPGRAPVTTAAFSPVRGEQFLVVGTSNGGVYLWKPPTEARKTHTGRIVNIDPTDTRYVTVRVEMSNAELKLLDHSTVTIIIPTNP
jgi:WD40 repeat protein/biotin carboxyl carrier protein